MIEVYSDKDYTVMKFEPGITNLFGKYWLSDLWFVRKIRFLLMYFTGYRIYYMFSKTSNMCIAQCVIAEGSAFWYREFASQKDIVVGPLFVAKEMRGKKVSIKLLKLILNNIEEYENAYGYVRKTNTASIKAVYSSGFCYECDLQLNNVTRSIKKVRGNNGNNILVVVRK